MSRAQSQERSEPEAALVGGQVAANELPALLELILSTCGAGRVLDVGCGDDRVMSGLLREAVDCRAVGVAAGHAEAAARARLADRFEHGSPSAMPFADAEFDTVVCFNTLDVLPEADVPAALEEFSRVVRHHVFVRVRTRAASRGEAAGPTLVRAREWWEEQFFAAGFRKHALHLKVASYESLEHGGEHADLVFEKLPAATPVDCSEDMLRQCGRQAEARAARYWAATPYIRPGDTVLDLACGVGAGCAVLAAETCCAGVVGVDASQAAIDYANVTAAAQYPCARFECGDPAALSDFADNSVDFVTAFGVVSQSADPEALLAELQRVVRPGGRILVGDASTGDEGAWARLRSQIEHSFLLEAGLAQVIADGPRKLQTFSSDEDPSMAAEWWLALGMKSPVDAADVPYVETHFTAHEQVEGFHVTKFARDYENPWIVRGLVSIGLRTKDACLLASMADDVARKASEGSADQGAALCLQAYRLLGDLDASVDRVQAMVDQLQAYRDTANATPHGRRWRISCTYVAAVLLLSVGKRGAARLMFLECAADDPVVFSPLLGSKTIDSLYHAGLISACDGELDAARACWLRALTEAQRLIRSDWTNVWGSPEAPLSFGLSEVRQLSDLASRCATALRSLEDWKSRPGVAWREAHRNAARDFRGLQQQVADLSSWIKELDQLQRSGWARATGFEAKAMAAVADLQESRQETARVQAELDAKAMAAVADLQESRQETARVQAELDLLQQTFGCRVQRAFARIRLRVAPKGSRRDRFLWMSTRAVAGLRHGPLGPFRAIKQVRQQAAAARLATPPDSSEPGT